MARGRFWTLLTAMGVALSAAGSVRADEAAQKLTAEHLAAGTLAAGDVALSALVERDPADNDARFGLGVVRFVRAVEHLSQGLYRYGMQSPQFAMFLPIVRLPVPPNPSPKPITYADFHGLLADFVADLGRAEATLAGIGVGPVSLPLDLRRVSYDVVGDGSGREPVIVALQRVTGLSDNDLAVSLAFGFDRGDVYWLRGYIHLMMAFGEFFLAHDWHESFDDTFHLFFPSANLAFSHALFSADAMDWGPIADLITFLHIRWPVAEPERMRAVRDHLKAVIALSRQTWDAVEAETDDDREWLPNPRQTSPFALLRVDQAHIDAWRAILDEAELLLDGRKLVPHWRFGRGINLRRVFEEPQAFDFVLWFTGPAALPYLEDGPVETSANWSRIVAAFGSQFGTYAAWFN
ncbi:MAG TPA: hypothetical protein VFB16_07110 [Bauldia sp.]|nr:hypothetical protein [Bauldia sp.]